MKKAILIFIAAWLLTGCLSENRDDCEAYLKLSFRHENSVKEFDDIIKNDVYVRIYKDDKLHQDILIPYQQIAGGKEYRVKKSFTGQLSIASWAVPPTGSSDAIPKIEVQSYFSSSAIREGTIVYNAAEFLSPMNDLYLGIVKDAYEEIALESSYIISMHNVVCRLNVKAALALFPSPGTNPHLNIAGTAGEISLEMEPLGEEAIIYAGLEKADADWLSLSVGLLPQYSDHTIKLTAYSNDNKLFTVDTEEVSIPGKIITVIISGMQAEIRVNGYRVRTTYIQL